MIDLSKINNQTNRIERKKVVKEEIYKAIENNDLNLSDIFFQYSYNGRMVLAELDKMSLNHELVGQMFKFVVKHSLNKGEFWIELGVKKEFDDPRTGKTEKMDTIIKSEMRRKFKRTQDPKDHYKIIKVCKIDEDGCITVPYELAKVCVVKYTNEFDDKRPSLLQEVDLNWKKEKQSSKKDK
jgi:hypothetical protein